MGGLKYVQLLCVAFFIKNSNCHQFAGSSVVDNFKLASIIASCMQNNPQKTFKLCHQNITDTSIDDISLNYELPDNQTDFHLYCRDAHKLMIQIDHNIEPNEYADENEAYVYMLILEEPIGNGTLANRMIFYSNEKLINVTVDVLRTVESMNLSYNIAVFIISSNASVQGLGIKQFSTLMENYKPEDITDIQLKYQREYYDEEEEDILLDLTFEWSPGRDQTCKYEITIHGNNYDLESRLIPIQKLYEYTFERLRHNNIYSVAVKGINSHDSRIYSTDVWESFPFINEIDEKKFWEILRQSS